MLKVQWLQSGLVGRSWNTFAKRLLWAHECLVKSLLVCLLSPSLSRSADLVWIGCLTIFVSFVLRSSAFVWVTEMNWAFWNLNLVLTYWLWFMSSRAPKQGGVLAGWGALAFLMHILSSFKIQGTLVVSEKCN